MATIVLMVIMAYGGSLVLGGSDDLSGEALILFLMIFSQIIPPAKEFSTAWINIQKGHGIGRPGGSACCWPMIKLWRSPDAIETDEFQGVH